MKRWLFVILLLSSLVEISAHEVRPGYLDITENEDGTVAIIWKVPLRGTRVLSIMPEFSDKWLQGETPRVTETRSAIIWRWNITPAESLLRGQTITIIGLDITRTDVIVKVNFANGTKRMQILKPESPSFSLKDNSTGIAAIDYMRLGIEHIMLGIDHLLFVFGLMLLSKTTRLLIQTITAFTIGHSISLALATLGFINVAGKPLAAVIALSILFLGSELIKARQGGTSLTIRKPWLVSFGFGIIHGLGFAGGLVKLGLPQTEIPLALLFFNVGVEIGQIVFIFLVIVMIASYKKMEFTLPNWSNAVPAYVIGSFAAFWFIGRLLVMLNL